MWRATWKGLAGHRLRLILTLLAIVLGVGLVSGSYVFTDTLTKVFDDLFAESFAGIDVQVRGRIESDLGFAFPDRLDIGLVDEVAAVPGVEVAVPNIGGLLTLIGPDGEVVGGQGPPTIGGNWSDVASPFRVRQGRAPAADGELAVDAATARRNGLAVGDRVQIISLGEAEDFEVVGWLKFGGSENFGGATFLAFEFSTAQRLFEAEDQVDAISVVATAGLSPEQLVERIESVLPEGFEAVTAQTAAEEQLATFKEALSFLNTFLLVFGFVALFVGAFLIQNTFQIVVAQRTRELALLRALGATRSQVTRMVLTEALIVSVIASLLGVGLGLGLAVIIRIGFEAFGGDLPATGLQLRPRTVLVAVTAGVLVTLASALLPARRAGSVPPVAAMRLAHARVGSRSLHRRAVVGGLVLALGLLLGAVGVWIELPWQQVPPVALVGVGSGTLFIGLAVLAPIFARPIGRTLGAPLPTLVGATGKLARENAVRSPRRTAATASALMVGVALVGLVTILAASIRATTDALIADRFRSDLVVQPAGFGGAGLSPAIGDGLALLPEVETVTRIRRGPVKIDETVRFLAGTDLRTLTDTVRLSVLAGDLAAVGGNAVAVSSAEADENDWGIGDVVNMTFSRTGTIPLEIQAIYRSEGPGADFYIGLDTWDENFIERLDSSLFVRFVPDADTIAARAAVEAVVDEFPGTTVLDQTEFRDQAVSQLDAFVLLVFALLTLALFIGFVGIVNTLLLSVYERTREIGLLRAVGTTRGQLRQMITWEAVIIATFGAVLGTAVGLGFGWAVVQSLGGDTPLEFRIPVGQLGLAVVLAALAGVVAAIYPARRAARLDILRAIAYE